MADVFRTWSEKPPTLHERIEATNRLSELMKQVYGVDREEPEEEEDPGKPRSR
jgi:hypothetical protein